MECAALNRLATLAMHGDPGIEPMELLAQALEVAHASGDRIGLAETEWTFAHINFVRREAEASIAHGERALDLAHELGLEELEARSLNVLAYACTDVGDGNRRESTASKVAPSSPGQATRQWKPTASVLQRTV